MILSSEIKAYHTISTTCWRRVEIKIYSKRKASVRREETGERSHAYEIVTRFGLRMRTKADVDRSLAGMKAKV